MPATATVRVGKGDLLKALRVLQECKIVHFHGSDHFDLKDIDALGITALLITHTPFILIDGSDLHFAMVKRSQEL